MSENKIENLENLNADEATTLLSAFYAKQLQILTDKNTDFARTFFLIASSNGPEVAALQDAVLKKNGIEKIQGNGPICHDYLPEIIAAVESRGSNAAEPIKKYHTFTMACNKKAIETSGFDQMSQEERIRLRINIAKNMPAP